MSQPVNVRIVCTDRGDHDEWLFGESIPARVADRGRYFNVETLTQRGRPEGRDGPHVFRCPRCGRNPRLTEKQWRVVCREWRRLGRDTLDISDLPGR